ncbi:MAG: amino acid permease [Bryobacteraceae bacterium]|nr:amino acid permease [Bryobacteraceae bacterium]
MSKTAVAPESDLQRQLGLLDSTMMVIGSMIGSGIFIVSAEIARQVGSPGWLLVVWLVTGVLTVAGALSYGELASMMPHAGGQYLYLREAFSPLWGFLYGWTLFLVIQTGTVAAVSIAFARFSGVIFPPVSESNYLIPPLHLTGGYAISLSTAQLVGVVVIALLTWTNTRGLQYGKLIQNVFTVAKTGALAGLVVLGLFIGWNGEVVAKAVASFWQPSAVTPIAPELAATTVYGLFIAICISQTGSLFSADAWNNITFTAGEVKDPKRNIALSLALGTGAVILLYLLANVAYIVTLPLEGIQHAPSDRVATAVLERIFPGTGTALMAGAIMISTFGCMNGLILAGARAYFAMARDGVFFPRAAELNAARVPGWALIVQGVWSALLVLPRTFDPVSGTYGNLYGNLLDYVMSAALIFYVLTIAGIFRLRRTRPDAERPYKAFGYPVVPGLYIAGTACILGALFVYRPATTWPGVVIAILGVPVYLWFRSRM